MWLGDCGLIYMTTFSAVLFLEFTTYCPHAGDKFYGKPNDMIEQFASYEIIGRSPLQIILWVLSIPLFGYILYKQTAFDRCKNMFGH